MKRFLLPEEGTFFKANLHAHTNISDGNYSPEEVKRLYKEQGYAVVAYTDHDIFVPHNDLCDKDFLALNAHEAEITEPKDCNGKFKKTYHLNFYAKKQEIKYSPVFSESRVWAKNAIPLITEEMRKTDLKAAYDLESVNRMIRTANENGFFVCYNHPFWSLQNYPDYAGLKGLWGIEVFNTGCKREGLPDSTQPFHDLLREGNDLFPLCTDDSHIPIDYFGGWVQIKAKELTYDSIVAALLRGDFYASTGPKIKELYYEDGELHVTTDEVTEITVIADWRYSKFIRPESGAAAMTSAVVSIHSIGKEVAELGIPPEASFFRLELADAHGNRAYTRAYRLSELQ